MNNMQMLKRNVLMSIRPEFSSKILSGEKTVELRRRFPTDAVTGATAVIYASSPTQAVVGYARIQKVLELPIEQIWREHNKSACITKEKFDAYFEGVPKGYAIVFGEITKFSNPIKVAELREEFNFVPPQSFQYLTDDFARLLNDE